MRSAQLGQVLTCSEVLRNYSLTCGVFVLYNLSPKPPAPFQITHPQFPGLLGNEKGL